MKLTIDECLEKWAGIKVGMWVRKESESTTERCLVNVESGDILSFPDAREILAALVAKAGGELEI